MQQWHQAQARTLRDFVSSLRFTQIYIHRNIKNGLEQLSGHRPRRGAATRVSQTQSENFENLEAFNSVHFS